MDELKDIQNKKDLWKVYSRSHEIFGNGDGKRWENLSWRLMALEGMDNSQKKRTQQSSTNRFSAPPSLEFAPTSTSISSNISSNSGTCLDSCSADEKLKNTDNQNNYFEEGNKSVGETEDDFGLFCYNCKSFKADLWHKSTTVPLIILCNSCLHFLSSFR